MAAVFVAPNWCHNSVFVPHASFFHINFFFLYLRQSIFLNHFALHKCTYYGVFNVYVWSFNVHEHTGIYPVLDLSFPCREQ